MLHNILLNLIIADKYEFEKMLFNIDIFLAFDRISSEQYQELHELILSKSIDIGEE